MKRCAKLRLLVLLAAALTLASCGGTGTGHQGGSDDLQGIMQGMNHDDASGENTGDMSGMGHHQMGHHQMGHHQMGHDQSGPGGMAPGMLMENGKYSDERFIDTMVPHHHGAVEMARVALENAEHEEITQLSRNIISTQQAEIQELKSIKEEGFGTSRVPMEMSPQQMQSMGMMDAQELAKTEPFDRAFIDAMIPHHQAAIEMAQVALENSDNPEVKQLAGNIRSAQRKEIEQMKQWRVDWYPQD